MSNFIDSWVEAARFGYDAQRVIGLGGAVIGIGVGLWGAARRRPQPADSADC